MGYELKRNSQTVKDFAEAADNGAYDSSPYDIVVSYLPGEKGQKDQRERARINQTENRLGDGDDLIDAEISCKRAEKADGDG